MLKLHNKGLEELDPLCAKITALNRVVLFSNELMQSFSLSDVLKIRLAFPYQINLPSCLRTSPQRALYPKKYGFKNFIDAFRQKLESLNVKILTEHSINSVNLGSSNDIEVHDHLREKSFKISKVDNLVWAAGLPSIAKLLGISINNIIPDKRDKVYYVHLYLEKLPNTKDLYYFYCFDEDYSLFRFTNYYSYCKDAYTSKGYHVCAEMWPKGELDEEELKLKTINNEWVDWNTALQLFNCYLTN